MPENIKWLKKRVVLSIHEKQILIHGGLVGLRDEDLLDSALYRPLNLKSYEDSDLFDLAACYAGALIKNHPFVDGNKRTGFLSAYSFLYINGYRLSAPEPDTYMIVIALTQNEIDMNTFAKWLKNNCKELKE